MFGFYEPGSPPAMPPEDHSSDTEREPESGQSIEETDRKRASEMRGENLTEEEFAERARHIAQLRRAIDVWAAQHVPKGEEFDARTLRALVEYISTEHTATVNAITQHFSDRRRYPRSRQVVKLRLREVGNMPDVLIFGWRGSDSDQGETKIHDHADSTVAVKVHEGEIQETVYRIEQSEWPDRKPGQAMTYHPPPKTRRYGQGLGKSCRSPYIHTIGGTPEHEQSVTIHAYWRPSTEVAYDFRIDGEQLIEIGVS